jgi:glycosyltransferase involved in cell wall biosynthesis
MRIGFDAKYFFSGNPSGRVVVRNLVREIILNNREHDLFIFLKKAEKGMLFPFSGPKVHPVYIWGKVNSLSNIFVFPAKASRLNLDVCVFQYFAPLFSNFKTAVYIHDVYFISNPEYYTWLERLYCSPIRFLSRRSDLVCTTSNSEKDRILKYKFSNQSIAVIHHGIEDTFFPRDRFDPFYLKKTASKYRLPGQYLLFVGRLNVRKNLDNLLRAIRLLEKKDTPLVIVGDKDWKMFNIEKMVSDLQIKNRIIFLGSVYGRDLAAIYALASVFCFPTYAESFGLPVLEAMAAGIPVVASDIPAMHEVCGNAGNYVDPYNPQDIASAIDRLLRDKELYGRKKAQGLERAKIFSWKRAACELMQVCTNLHRLRTNS